MLRKDRKKEARNQKEEEEESSRFKKEQMKFQKFLDLAKEAWKSFESKKEFLK